MLYDPVSYLPVHHVEYAERVADARRARPLVPRLRAALTAVAHRAARAAYVRTRAAHLASSRPA